MQNDNMFYQNPMMGGMYPNQMVPNNYNMTSNIESRLNKIEKQLKRLDQRISRLETPYQNNNHLEDDNNMYMI